MDIDLNIDNYNLNELLDLFKLRHDFSSYEFKEAKKIVLAIHPDKSKLPSEYFIFFSKAYKLLYKVYEFKHKKTDLETEKSIISDKTSIRNRENKEKKDSAEQKLVNELSKSKNFNKKFNELFEKNYISQDTADGYGSWLSENNDISDTEAFKQGNEKFKELKSKSRALAIREEPEGIGCSLGSSLVSDGTRYGGGDLRLVYEQETVMGVDESDMDRDRVNNLEELRRARGAAITPLSREQAQERLNRNTRNDEIRATERAVRLVEQEEKYEKQTNTFWAALKQLSNN